MRDFPPFRNDTESLFCSETSKASTASPAPSGASEKSRTTAGFFSEIGPQSFAYFFKVTFLTTAPQVESSSFTSSFSSVTIFSGVEGRTFFCSFSTTEDTESTEGFRAGVAASVVSVVETCATTFVWARAARFAASFDFPLSL